MKSIICKVNETESKLSKSGKYYKVCTFEKIAEDSIFHPILGTFSICSKNKQRRVVLYEDDFGYSEPIGANFLGDIITKIVEPYDIINQYGINKVNTYSVLIFGDSESEVFNLKIHRSFKSAGHIIENMNTNNFTVAK